MVMEANSARRAIIRHSIGGQILGFIENDVRVVVHQVESSGSATGSGSTRIGTYASSPYGSYSSVHCTT